MFHFWGPASAANKSCFLLNAETEINSVPRVCSCNLASSSCFLFVVLFSWTKQNEQTKISTLEESLTAMDCTERFCQPPETFLAERANSQQYFKLYIKMLTTCYLLVSLCSLFGLRPSDITACQRRFVIPIHNHLPAADKKKKKKRAHYGKWAYVCTREASILRTSCIIETSNSSLWDFKLAHTCKWVTGQSFIIKFHAGFV